MNKTKNAESKGITLIALIITIIIMLILVTVSITMAVKGGLFKYASDAVKGTKNAKEEEEKLAKGMIEIDGVVYDSLDMYLKGIPSGTELFSEIKEESYNYIDKNNETARIPAGFAVGTSEGINTIAGGLVITDKVDEKGKSIGNEFVWIPVKDGEFTRTGWWDNMTMEEIKAKNYTLEELLTPLATWSADCEGYFSLEEAMEDYDVDTEEDLINDMGYFEGDIENRDDIISTFCRFGTNYTEDISNALTSSVETYGGFYIGRYEAGYSSGRTDANRATTAKPLCQKGSYPYNYITWTDAVDRSEKMYEGSESVVSSLCYGVQWDATLRFIRDKFNVSDSTSWGNYNNSSFKFTGGYSTDYGVTWDDATNKDKPERTNYLLTTGASDRNKAKNIYDLAGNVYEWTMESDGSSYRVHRGGNFNNYGGKYPAALRYNIDPSYCSDLIGFRVSLYVK